MNKKRIFALFGESGSGKDTILNYITNHLPNAKRIVSCTTRPKREYEKDGIDYHFLTNEQFAKKVVDFSMLEATEFHNWFYGTSIEELDDNKINVGVFNIEAIRQLSEDNRLLIYPVYVAAAPKVRLMRSLNREELPDCSEICRRFIADKKDFEKIDFNFQTIVNNGNKIPKKEIKKIWLGQSY